jgi:CHAD domain-containing protein
MELELDNVRKPVRKLRRLLKSLPNDPPIKVVHNLRTCARRLEAIASALIPGRNKPTRRLLKTLKPVRKAAGKVRDMDVLTGKARTLASLHRDDSILRLLGHLQAMRIEGARELLDTVAKHRKDARRGLKRFFRQIEKRFHAQIPHATSQSPGNGTKGDEAIKLIEKLSRWPAFDAENLHPFRIKVKELRYVLQLAEGADLNLIRALGKVRQQIGDWHDWQQLAGIAEKVLDPQKDLAALKEIEEIGNRKFKAAFAAAHAIKTRYLGGSTQAGSPNRSRSSSHPA